MDVISPNMIDTDNMPRRKANASTGFMWKVNGSINASAVGDDMPGKMPTINPINTPIIMSGKVGHEKTEISPLPMAPK